MTHTRSSEDFGTFYRVHYSMILATVSRRVNDRSTAEDLTSEVFKVAWAHYQSDGDLTLAWLYTVARNVVGNEYRRTLRSSALTTKLTGHAFEAVHETDSTTADTRRAMMKLKEADREILFMAYWEDLTGNEIAEILGCKVPTVWVRLNRARAALRNHLEMPLTMAVDNLREEGVASNG